MSDHPSIVVLDACVLYPAGLRSLMMWLAVHELIRPKWTEQIHEEWIRNVLADRPDLSRNQLERTRRLMDLHAGDCLVAGHERKIPGLHLPDNDDRHVLAAALHAKAAAIITWNLQDFPIEIVTTQHGIRVMTPDQMLRELLDFHERRVIEAMEEHRISLKNPPKTRAEYLETLQLQGLTQSVALLGKNGFL